MKWTLPLHCDRYVNTHYLCLVFIKFLSFFFLSRKFLAIEYEPTKNSYRAYRNYTHVSNRTYKIRVRRSYKYAPHVSSVPSDVIYRANIAKAATQQQNIYRRHTDNGIRIRFRLPIPIATIKNTKKKKWGKNVGILRCTYTVLYCHNSSTS